MVTRSRLKKSGGRKKVSRLKKKGYIYSISTRPNAYGFGRDYTLNIKNNNTGKSRSFWLGQDAKVFSRILGIDMRDAIDHYSDKANSKDFDKVQKFIAEDVIKAISGTEDIDAGLKKIMEEAEDWSLHVGGG